MTETKEKTIYLDEEWILHVKKKLFTRWYMIILYSFIGFLFLVAIATTPEEGNYSSTNSNKQTSKFTGDEGILYVEGLDKVGVATTKAALDELTKASVARDSIGYARVYQEGRAFQVKTNTKILVLENTFTTTKVRILEGEHYGKSGWVPYEWIK